MSTKHPGSRLKSYTPQAIYSAPPGERKHILRRFWFPAVILLALAAGGLTGIISKFEHGGMTEEIGSWVGTGANMPVTGGQLQEILGTGSIGQIAQRSLPDQQRSKEIGYVEHLLSQFASITYYGNRLGAR